MINRILIRIKVLQIVYSFYQNGNNDLKVAENELLFSLRKSYDLYHYFLLLIIEVTNLQRRTLDAKKCKYMPTHAELNPNTRLVDNRFAAQVAENEALQKYVAEQGLSWVNDEEFVKNVLDIILASILGHLFKIHIDSIKAAAICLTHQNLDNRSPLTRIR